MFEDTSYIADVSQESKQGHQTPQNISFDLSNYICHWKSIFKIDFVYGGQLSAHIFKTNFVYMAGNQMNLPPNQKQIKSPLITSDAVSCPVTITIIKHQWGNNHPQHVKIKCFLLFQNMSRSNKKCFFSYVYYLFKLRFWILGLLFSKSLSF